MTYYLLESCPDSAPLILEALNHYCTADHESTRLAILDGVFHFDGEMKTETARRVYERGANDSCREVRSFAFGFASEAPAERAEAFLSAFTNHPIREIREEAEQHLRHVRK